MKKLISILLAICMVVSLCCGCSETTAFENPVPDTTVEHTLLETQPQTEASSVANEPSSYQMGDEVFVVYQNEGVTNVKRAIVVMEDGQHVVTTYPGMGSIKDLEDLRAALDDGYGAEMECLEFFPIGDCYRTSKEAKIAAYGEDWLEWMGE